MFRGENRGKHRTATAEIKNENARSGKNVYA
jgi:hypothetical protein